MIAVAGDMLDSCVREIIRVSAPDRIILFGSRATGAETEDSDIDLLVIGEPSEPARWSRIAEMNRIRRSIPDLGIPVDILFFTPEEVAVYRGWINHVVAEAIRTGRVLYDRA